MRKAANNLAISPDVFPSLLGVRGMRQPTGNVFARVVTEYGHPANLEILGDD